MYLSEDCIGKLLATLAERPVDQGGLWAACWGGVERNGKQIPANVDRIARDILGAGQSRVILVHGRYGTGKSSFMKSIRTQIEDEVTPLWLDMPSLTSHIDSTALAAVMIRIAETLQTEVGDTGSAKCNFGQALEDLWRIEARAMRSHCSDPCDSMIPPEPNRMAGTVRGEGRRFVKANTLEKTIQTCLESFGGRLVVFLDDLDRCERVVAMDVVRLLLRFGAVSNVHFVLACDWDVLEQGVKDWMHQHGKADDGAPLVTANSALEKYIHIPVELPGLGEVGVAAPGESTINDAVRKLLRETDGIVRIDAEEDTVYKKSMLFDTLMGQLLDALTNGECA